MAAKIPTARSAMTSAPTVIDGNEDTLSARSMMEDKGVRHLPVMLGDQLYGVLSDRDLRAARAFLDCTPGHDGPPVSALCSRDPYVVRPDDPIDDVAIEMANRRLGAAVVVEGTTVVGIVTTVDLCRELAKIVGQLRAQTT